MQLSKASFTGAILTLFAVVTLTACNTSSKESMEDHTNESAEKKPADDSPRVTGIGGIFFYTDNPQEAKDWYTKNLGIDINDWGSSSFDSRDLNDPEVVNTLQWMPFNKASEHFAPSKKEFMINYTVQHIEELVEKLKKNGVTILDEIATYDYGKFVHIMDSEGNKIELWEPA